MRNYKKIIGVLLFLFLFIPDPVYSQTGFTFDAKDVTIKEGSHIEITGTIITEFQDKDFDVYITDKSGIRHSAVIQESTATGSMEVKFRLPDNIDIGDYTVTLRDKQNISVKYTQEFNAIVPNVDSLLKDIRFECTTDELLEGSCTGNLGGNTFGGGCLIATATFGTELAPQVQQLRELRDKTLLQTNSGISFMSSFNQFYYSFSPTIADWERENPVFKEAVKLTIMPLLTSLSILNYVDIDSEEEVLGYGIGIILLNIGLYFVAPMIAIMMLRRKL